MKRFLTHALHVVPIIGLAICAILYPFWIINGYLYEWYPIIGSAVAIYGGLPAFTIWYIKHRKNI